MFHNYLTIAWRNLLHQKRYSLINTGSLTIALTAVILMMMWVQNEFRFDNYHPAADRVFLITNREQTDISQSILWEHSPYPLAGLLSRQFPEVELTAQMSRSQPNEIHLRIGDRIFTQDYAVYVDDNWFNLFSYDVLDGTLTGFSANPYSLVLTESKARTLFGLAQVTGRSIRIDSTDYVVKAVIKDNPVNSSFQFEVMMPLASVLNTPQRKQQADNWLYTTHRTFVRLHPRADPAQTAHKITGLYDTHREKKNLTASLLPLAELHFGTGFKVSAFVHGDQMKVRIFLILAALMLLTACINYVNLSVARISVRAKEIGVRKMVGASRMQLFRQLLTESALLSGIALVLTLILVRISLPAFNTFTGQHFPFNPFDLHTAGLLLGCWTAILLLISIYPALLLSSINPVLLFRGNVFFRLKASAFRQGLTIGQLGLAVIMVFGAIGVYRQLAFMQRQHAGYDRSQFITVQVPSEHVRISSYEEAVAYGQQLDSRLQALKRQLQQESTIREVVRLNMSSVVNNGYTISGGVDWDGRPADFQPEYVSFSADEDLDKALHFTFTEGRWFDSRLHSDRANVVLNETAVRQFGLKPPVIGKRFDQGQIIGVVKDFYHKSLHEKIVPLVIRINSPNKAAFLVQTRPGHTTQALEAVQAGFAKQFPHQPLTYSFIDQEFDQLYRDDRKALQFTWWFCGLSVLIACMGLLGMMTFITGQRRKEISVRKVLGASVSSIVALLSAGFLKQMAIATIIASPIAVYSLNYWLKQFAYKADPAWWMVIAAGLLAMSIALLTISVQSVKAARANPAKALQQE